jgi:chromosome transmission fidelity protein 4
MDSDEPTLYRIVDGIIRRLEVEDEATSACVWHPDGRAFACATATRDITTVSVLDGAQQRSFIGGHMTEILSLAWSANGALLATCSRDGGLVIWETKTQSMIKKFDYENTMNVTWHPQAENYLNWTTSLGEVYICPNFLKDEAHVRLLKGPRARSPFFHDPLDETSAAINGRKPLVNGRSKPVRAGTPDSLDILLGEGEEEDWIEDDDGAGYINGNGKRPNGHLGTLNGRTAKRGRQGYWSPQIHEPFQPGATPWRGNRKYLCLNLIGFVWTVDQDTHHTVTVEFYDRELHRDFHFTDPYLYDKACLNEKGTLFSCPSNKDHAAMVFYRPHETWTARADWRTQLPEGEEVTALALSKSFVTVLTTKGYVRVYTLFGTPYRIWRQKRGPAVTCAAFDDYVLTVGNGTVGSDGCTELVYSIEDVRRGEVCQNEDVVAIGEAGTLKNVFFSDDGDPCIYDSSGTLLVLAHWRTPNQAKWIPLLDTTKLDRLASGRKEESYWPVAVAQGRFHCIILKGGDQHPYFPRPLLSEFDFKVPVTTLPPKKTAADGDEAVEESNAHAGARLEESFIRSSVLHSLLDDVVSAVQNPPLAQRTELTRCELEIDKILLQLLAVECREGEERGMKALEIVGLMRDRGGKMIEAAGKVAGRWGRLVLEEKIREVGERRLMGLDGVDEDEL